MIPEDYLTVLEAAQTLKVSTTTIQTWCKEGKLPSYRVGRSYRIPKDEFGAWCKSAKIKEPQTIEVSQVFEVELSALVQAWIKDMEIGSKPCSADTIRTHRKHFYKFIRILLGNDPSGTLSYTDAVNGKALGRVLSRIPVTQFASRYNVYSAVVAFCGFLVRQGLLSQEVRSAMTAFKPKRLLPAKKSVLHSTDEINRFFEALWMTEAYSTYEKTLNSAMVGLMVYAGLRVSEVAKLELSHLDLLGRIVYVVYSKGGRPRMVGVNDRLKGLLEAYLCMRPGSDAPQIFLAEKGTSLCRDYIVRRISRLSKRSGLTISAHGLRRTFATQNAKAGKSLHLIQLALGHRDISTTQEYLMAREQDAALDMRNW